MVLFENFFESEYSRPHGEILGFEKRVTTMRVRIKYNMVEQELEDNTDS
jgi:hypothetical protein